MPHTRSPPFRRRLQWPTLLSLTILLSTLWLPSTLASPFAPDTSNLKSASEYLVTSLPGAPELLKMYAGHIEVTPEHHGNLFFWLYEARKKPPKGAKESLVVWFNGGPGCSSLDGALMEIGSYRVNPDGTLRIQEGGWDEFANVLFIDNPVGTGFSFVDGDSLLHDLDQMAEQVVVFLEKWFAVFEKFRGIDIYIAGESYAGQHIPYIAQAILSRNQKKSSDPWNLQALMIGNGWISGVDQYSSYIPFMKEQGILQDGTQAAANADAQQERCNAVLSAGDSEKVDTNTCEQIMMGLSRDLSEGGMCYNIYDVRLKDTYPSCGMRWPPDLAQLTPYLRRDDVRRALNLDPDQKAGWTECNNQVNFAFSAAHSKPSKTLLPGLLEHMPIVLFSGDKDLICNHIGTENLIANLRWNGEVGMDDAPVHEWTMDGEAAGQYQMARNLTYLRFYNSSHMVPFDYPKRARDMLDRVMSGESIKTINGKPKNSIIEDDVKEVVPPSQGQDPGEEQDDKTPPPPPTNDNDNDNETDEDDEKDQEESDWTLYYRSGEAALLFVSLAAAGWGFFVWRSRRKRRLGYGRVNLDDDDRRDGPGGAIRGSRGSRLGLATAEERFRNRERDLEEAGGGEEMDVLDHRREKVERERERFSLGDSDEDEGDEWGVGGSRGRANGHV